MSAFEFPCTYPQLALVDAGWTDNGNVACFETADGTAFTIPIDQETCNFFRTLIAQRQAA